MALLSDDQYEEYIRLLRDWVDAEKALEGPADADAGAAQRAREAHAAVQDFRERYGLDGHERQTPAAVGSGDSVQT